MIPIYGPKRSPLCDGISRRDVLRVGALGAGLTLTDLLRAEAARGERMPPLRGAGRLFLIDRNAGEPVESARRCTFPEGWQSPV